MRHIFSSFLLLTALAFVSGCTDNLDYATDFSNFDEGELTEGKLNVAVDSYVVTTTTRAATPNDTANDSASVQEKAIDNIWVFQYDTSGNMLIKPRYYSKASKATDSDKWIVLLKENVASTIYVVTNTSDSTWATSLTKFATLDSLKAQMIPNPDLIDSTKTPDFYIPMAGSVEIGADQTGLLNITVPVERMFAKLIISTKMVMPTESDTMKLMSIEVNNVPYSCRVGSRSCADTDTESEKEASTYSSNFILWTLEAENTTGIAATEDGGTSGTVSLVKQPNIILYVPENIQGEVDEGSVDKQTGTGVPDRALTVRYTLKVYIHADEDHDIAGGYTTATIPVYPGSNTTNNFNVKRNRIYKITGTFPTYEYFYPTPSANCLIVEPNSSLIFWPYYRTETGGSDAKEEGGFYNIRTYLDPTVDSLTIDSVAIIWQDKDVIGDNSNGDKVTWSKVVASGTLSKDEKYEYLKERFRIRVQTQAEGNALIGGYNSKGEIIWSWHIWVTDNDPGNVGNAIPYTTYDWNSSGIICNTADPYSSNRITGYRVMPCNLGAKELTPDVGEVTDTYGPLFQWGRKDPFPTMKATRTIQGFADYNNKTTAETGSDSKTGSNIQVYDNSNNLITMTGTGYINESSTELFKTVSCNSTSSATDDDTKRKDGLKYSIHHPTWFIASTNTSKGKFTAASKWSNQLGYNDNDYNVPEYYVNNGDWLLGHANGLWGGTEATSTTKHLKVNNKYTYNWGKSMPSDIVPYMWDNYGSEKTIFDPSPTGWRIPPSDFWLGLTIDGQSVHQRYDGSSSNKYATFFTRVNTTDSGSEIDKYHGMYVYLDGWKSEHRTFLPCPGTRLASGQVMHLNFCGNYHCASTEPSIINNVITDNGRVNCMHIHAQYETGSVFYICQINPFEYQRLFIYKAVAGPIRCVRDRR